MTETLDRAGLTALKHSFTIEPVTAARMKMLQARSHPGAYEEEPVPAHILAAVTQVDEAPGMVQLSGASEKFWMPLPVARPNWFSMARGYGQRMLGKYTLPGFVEVTPGDVVVDCGAFVGGFALGALRRRPGRVIAVEPAPLSYDCLCRNVQGTDITTVNAGLLDHEGEITFNLRRNATDNSLIEEEGGEVIAQTAVRVLTLPQLMQEQGIDKIDFLKLEAEGLELEILAHATPDKVAKIAIDAGPERFGQSPLLDIAVLLAGRGYRLANRNYWLYATT